MHADHAVCCNGRPADRGIAASDMPLLAAELDRAGRELASGLMRQALERVRRVLAQDPDCARALGLEGQIAILLGQPEAAIVALDRAVTIEPRMECWTWLAVCHEMLGRMDEALRAVLAAARIMPDTANAHFALAMVLERLGHAEAAAGFYAGCIRLDDGRADAHHRHGRTLQAAGRFEAAIEAYRRAIRRDPAAADPLADLSSALANLGRFGEARAAAEAAVRIDPSCVVGAANLGHALLNLNRSVEALPAYEAAIARQPDNARAQFGYAVALLKSGDFEHGWERFEWRWRDCQTPRADPGVPWWRGEALGGRTILLHAEQGLGDTLQFVRFATLVAARGGRVVLEVPRPLVRLLGRVDGVAELVACGDPLPPFDLHCPMASLPLAVGLRLDDVPAAPYLRVPLAEAACWKDRFREGAGRGQGLVVGLVWAGDPRPHQPDANRIDRRRSTTLAALLPLLTVAGVRFVSFQLGAARAQLGEAGERIVDAMDGVGDLADTAARLTGIDLLISVDTAMVHLAGGMGLPVWMLSRHDGCWRWLEQRADSPWYPSMRIFRQRSAGDWQGLVGEVRCALQALVPAAARSRGRGAGEASVAVELVLERAAGALETDIFGLSA